MFLRRPPAHCDDTELHRHPSWRRHTRLYRRKRRLVRDLWLGSGGLMLMLPPGAIPVLALATTFVAFMILDETP